jgi:hypothetical protein
MDAWKQGESNRLAWRMEEGEQDALLQQTVAAYQLHRRAADGAFSSTPITTIPADTSAYVDSDLPDAGSSVWCYQVKATDATDTIVGESNVACTDTPQAQGQQVYLPLVRRSP